MLLEKQEEGEGWKARKTICDTLFHLPLWENSDYISKDVSGHKYFIQTAATVVNGISHAPGYS